MAESDTIATRTYPPDANLTRSAGEPTTATGDAAAAIRELNTDTGVTVGTPRVSPSAIDPPPGFVLERELGEGGMGIVYLARQLGLNRPVALKLVKPSAKVDAKALIRFLAEAEVVASIKHPNVVEVHQYGEHAGKPFMALEFCPGGDLTTHTTSTPTRDVAWFRRVAELMAKVADGVNAAHAQGIVHRDLKPHNVFLAGDGAPKVADFGLAKRGVGSDLTNTEAVMGTPAYMAPEQAGGGTKFVGPEADVWALGVMLYELCCGHRPIDTSGPLLDALARVANADVSQLRTQQPAVPPDLALVAHKCLSRDPRDRYPTAGRLAADLRNWLDGKPISARPNGVVEQAVKWARRNKKLAGMGVAVLLTMAAATAMSLGFGIEASMQADRADKRQKDAEDATGRATAAETEARNHAARVAAQLIETRRLLDLGRLREAVTDFGNNRLQRAHDKMAEVASDNRCIAWGLLKRDVQGGHFTLWGHTGRVTSVAVSPDGRRIVSGSDDNTARVWDAATGQSLVELKGHTDFVSSVGFSPDGRQIVTGSHNTVRVWDATTGRKLHEFHRQPDEFADLREESEISGVAFSPDGRWIVAAYVGPSGYAEVWDAVNGSSRLELKGHAGEVTSVGFSPDGKRAVTGSHDKTARVWDTATGQTLVELKGHARSVDSVAFSADGRRIVTGLWGGTAQVWDAATGQPLLEPITHGDRVLSGGNFISGNVVRSVAFSPDGRRIVTVPMAGPTRVWDATTGQSLLEFKELNWLVKSAAISPDGTRIATVSPGDVPSRNDDPIELRVLDTTTGQRVVGFKPNREMNFVTFSPDGTRIATAEGRYTKEPAVRVRDAATGQSLLELTGHTSSVTSVGFSPDGRRIVTGSKDHTVRVWDAATGQSLLELAGHASAVTSVAVSPDGRRIVAGLENGMSRVWFAAPHRPRVVLEGHSANVRCVAVSPDGRRIVTGSEDKTARVWDAATGQTLHELKGPSHPVQKVGFSRDGQRIVTQLIDATDWVWDAATGQRLPSEPAPATVSSGHTLPDGQSVVMHGPWVVIVDRRVNAEELARRRWATRPRPDVHAKLAEEYKADPFASAVQRSLEQRACGRLAVEAGNFVKAWGHFIAAELVRPKSAVVEATSQSPKGK